MLKEKIETDFQKALKAGDVGKVSVLRLIKSAIKNAEIAAKESLDEDALIAVLSREQKKIQESIVQYRAAAREDLAKKEEQEAAIIGNYLPEKMDEAEIRPLVRQKIAGDGAGNFGKIMGEIMKELGNRSDGNTVRRILEEELSR